jgi:hypothetical protein
LVVALEHLGRRCHGDERPECPILDELGGNSRARGTLKVAGVQFPD